MLKLYKIKINKKTYYTHAINPNRARFNVQWQHDKQLTKVMIAVCLLEQKGIK